MSSRRHAGALALILVLAAGLRLFELGREGLWTDEATSAVLAQRALPDLVAALRADVQAPLHYLLLKGVIGMLGASELALRLPSALAGLAAVLACGLLGRRALGDAGSLLSALLLAVLPLHVAYSREARAYALLALLMLVAFFAVDALRRRPTWSRAALAGAVVALLPLTHALGGIQGLVVALAAGAPAAGQCATWRREALPKLAGAGLLAVLLASPWLAATMGQGAHAGVAYSWAQPAWDEAFPWQVPRSLLMLAPGVEAPERSLAPPPRAADLAAAAAAALLVGAAVVGRRRMPDPSLPLRALSAVVGSLLLTFAVSLVMGPLHVVGRVEAPLAPLAALAMGGAAAALRGRGRALVAGLAMTLVLASAWPLGRLLTSDARSFERVLCWRIVGEADSRDAVVALGAYRFPLEHELDRARTRPWIAGFPADRDRHPSWIDEAAHDDARLALEAADLASRVDAHLRRGGGDDAWLLTPSAGRESDAIRGALGARLRLLGRWRAWDSGWSVDRYQLLERPSDAAPSP